MPPTSPNAPCPTRGGDMNHGHYDQHWNFGGGAAPDQSCWGKDSHHHDWGKDYHHDDQHWNFGGGAGPDQSCWGKDSHHDDQHWHSGGWAAPAPCAPTPDAWENDQHCHQELEVKFYDQCEHQPVDHCAGFDGHDVVLLGLGC